MSSEVITTISPTTNEPILTRNGVSAAELKSLPETSAQAFESWRKTSLVDRQIIVKKALKLLGDKKDELASELTVQMGRPISYTGVEVTTAVKRGEYLTKISEDTLKDTPGEEEKGFKRFIRKVPVGPVLVIFAWNVSSISTAPYEIPNLCLSSSTVPILNSGQLNNTRTTCRKHSHPKALASNPNHRGASS